MAIRIKKIEVGGGYALYAGDAAITDIGLQMWCYKIDRPSVEGRNASSSVFGIPLDPDAG
jgi:hypothetical protein